MLEIRGQRVRLSGVKTPESETLCRGGGSLQYRSGAKAANELARFIAGRPVSCKACTLIDIGARARLALLAALILGIGWYVQGSGLIGLRIQRGKYERGVWCGSYVGPWDYRACIRNGGGLARLRMRRQVGLNRA